MNHMVHMHIYMPLDAKCVLLMKSLRYTQDVGWDCIILLLLWHSTILLSHGYPEEDAEFFSSNIRISVMEFGNEKAITDLDSSGVFYYKIYLCTTMVRSELEVASSTYKIRTKIGNGWLIKQSLMWTLIFVEVVACICIV